MAEHRQSSTSVAENYTLQELDGLEFSPIIPLQIQNDAMAEWIFRREQGCCAWLGRGPAKRSERRSRQKAICPHAMRSFWKVAAFRLTESIPIQYGRRALRCFQNELHHFIILNLKWYKI